MTVVHTVIDSPEGPLTLLAQDGGLAGLYIGDALYRPPQTAFGPRDDRPFAEAARQLGEYFAGVRREFDLPLALRGTSFQVTVWRALLRIPYGETTTYRELAESIGRPTAARAVGAANGRNPIGIVVPCHRVLGTDGTLTGYAAGVECKRRLLELEKVGR
ncbi:methylated-DNA--[protein]-cysteine S-methyltransferase [Amycolatopsis benzoatilytica]|uniref:methylated-DNA--[protein]-cysteine S-methyltransferase n=1 Tax=Amycolatopsis benzoatilytica TaxID=346045 RepID=UPI00037A39B8|nr:methylated-DNA--[protein]-cysteine S-methyltransferase [Amycolatopsis benzoatilytica]